MRIDTCIVPFPQLVKRDASEKGNCGAKIRDQLLHYAKSWLLGALSEFFDIFYPTFHPHALSSVVYMPPFSAYLTPLQFSVSLAWPKVTAAKYQRKR